MKRLPIFLLILFCCCASGAFSLELKLIEGAGNLAYNKKNTSALSDDADPGFFSPQYHPLILAELSGEISGLGYSFGFQREPILRNRFYANIRLEQEYFFLEAGPVIGLYNSYQLPVNPGVYGSIGAAYPGIIFFEAAGSSTLAAIPMEKRGNYSQTNADLRIGFWVPHVICSFNFEIKDFTLREKIALLIEDKQTRFYFRSDVFTKNFPYNFIVDIGYQSLKRSYISMGIKGTEIVQTTVTDELKSIFLGLEGSFTLTPALKLIAGGEIPVYSWSVRPMEDPPKSAMFFELRLGIIWTLSR